MKKRISKMVIGMAIATVSLGILFPTKLLAKTNDNKELEKLRKRFESFDEDEDYGWKKEKILGCEFVPDASLKKKLNAASLDINDPDDCKEFEDNYYSEKMTKKEREDSFYYIFSYYEDSFSVVANYNPTNFYVKTPDGSYVEILISPVSVHMQWPDFYIYDFDGDDEDELMIQPHVLHGTGYSEDTVIIVDKAKNDKWYAYHLLPSFYNDYFEDNSATIYKNGKISLEFMDELIDESLSVKSDDYVFIFDSLVRIYPSSDQIFVSTSPYAVNPNENDFMGEFSSYNLWLTLSYEGEGEFAINDELIQKDAQTLYKAEIEKLKKNTFYGFIEGPAVEEPLMLTTNNVCEEITADDSDSIYSGSAAEATVYMMKNKKLVKVDDLMCSSYYMQLRYSGDAILVENRFGIESFILENGKFVNNFAISRGDDSDTKFEKFDGKKWKGISERQYDEIRNELSNAHVIWFEKKI